MVDKKNKTENGMKIGEKPVVTHGRSYVATVVSDKMRSTVTVAWKRRVHIPKYERYMVKTSKVKAHNPESIDAKEGDLVRIMQCRPISKTKNFVVVEIVDGATADLKESEESTTKKTTKKKSAPKKQ